MKTRPFSAKERDKIVTGMLCVVLLLVIMQLWLLTATMNASLAGDQSVVWPAAFARPGWGVEDLRAPRGQAGGLHDWVK